MILGAIQVVRNVADLAAAEAPLLAAGFTPSFREQLVSHPAKAPLLGAARADGLAMTHLTVPPGPPAPAVELTTYAGAPPAGVAAFALEADADGRPLALVSPTDDPAAADAFWSALAASADEDGRRRFAAALPAWRLEVITPEGPSRAGTTTVDADGCVLVSVLTSGLDAELARLDGLGVLRHRATAPWDEQVGGRLLRVAIVEGPAGELVELLQISSR